MKPNTIVIVFILALTTGLAVVSCDVEEAAKDAAGDQIDTSFDEDVTMTLEPVEASDGGEVQTFDMDCGTTSVREELEKHDVEEDDVDIESIDLNFVEGQYSEAVWMPVEVTNINCAMTLTGSIGSVLITEEHVDKGSSSWTTVEVSDEAKAFIDHYLDHRDEEFSYCVECTDADSYSVMWQVKIGVTVKGEIL